ncbi:MAG: ABC transporter permease [Clostridiales bacterium]|jgi:simple sugar transport system permease protein|nr:ABC transporter permease [Clostridiales bacterium]
MNYLLKILPLAVRAGIPILLGTVGEILTEKAGNLNLGVEGMMLMGAFGGFQIAVISKNPVLALLAAFIMGGFGALIYTFLTVTLKANQVVTGLSLTIFGTGLASFFGNSLNSGKVAIPAEVTKYFGSIQFPFLTKIPYAGTILFNYDIFVYLAVLLAVGMHFYLKHTKTGLNLRAVGEDPASADAAGINITLYKYANICLGGALCGLGGAYLSIVYIPSWTDNFVSGRGWIAVALVIFASWSPLRAIFGSVLFGGLSIIGTKLQTSLHISPYFLDLLPFLVTLLVLIFTSIKTSRERQQPKGCGNNYFREER